MTSRSDVLTTAERLVNGDRDQAHGQPAHNLVIERAMLAAGVI